MPVETVVYPLTGTVLAALSAMVLGTPRWQLVCSAACVAAAGYAVVRGPWPAALPELFWGTACALWWWCHYGRRPATTPAATARTAAGDRATAAGTDHAGRLTLFEK